MTVDERGRPGGEPESADRGQWGLAQRLALVVMAATPLVLGVAVFLLLKLSRG